ncbi:MAG TPA: hypothetical protein VEL05_08610, partial [Candidatus Acidoferrum sp.]|nr:hypothetical protein [Candidatus Acidoferrum sp.]
MANRRRAGRAGAASLAAALTAALHISAAGAQPPPGSLPGGGGDQPVDPYAAPGPTRPEKTPSPPPAESAPEPENETGPLSGPGDADIDDVDDLVAQALYRRGVELYRRGAPADAKTLFIESLERSPSGRAAGEALRMLRATNRRLGVANLDDGRPTAPSQEGVLDPYGAGAPATGGEDPLDPYAGASRKAAPAGGGAGPVDEPEEPEADLATTLSRPVVIGWSGAVGFLAGMAAAGPENDAGKLADGAVIAGLVGAAGGVGLSYWLTRSAELTAGQSAAIASGATWGATMSGLLGDATGRQSAANDVWKYVAAGGLVGLGGGVLYARMARPSEGDIALTNSLAGYGAAAGLFIAAGIDPPAGEAFSLNALFGSTAGIAAGLFLAPRIEVSRRRTLFLDLGALAGAAAVWALAYPPLYDGNSHADEQVAGWASTLTMGGGVALAWFFTRGMDTPDAPLARRKQRP